MHQSTTATQDCTALHIIVQAHLLFKHPIDAAGQAIITPDQVATNWEAAIPRVELQSIQEMWHTI